MIESVSQLIASLLRYDVYGSAPTERGVCDSMLILQWSMPSYHGSTLSPLLESGTMELRLEQYAEIDLPIVDFGPWWRGAVERWRRRALRCGLSTTCRYQALMPSPGGWRGVFPAQEYAVKQPHRAFSRQVEWRYSTSKDYDPCGDLFFHDSFPY
jgi:hypothetical protein